MGLLSMNINASKQFNMKEEQVQARHQAEMGVLHYEAVLKEKIMSSSSSVITCANIESILGNTKKIAGSNYTVTGGSNNSNSCTLLSDGKRLEIKIKSTGIINNNTEKEVEATFYAVNTGGTGAVTIIEPTEPKPPVNNDQTPNESMIIRDLGRDCKGNGNNCTFNLEKINDVYTINKFAILEDFVTTSKDSFHFKNHMVVNNMTIGGGNMDAIKVNKNLYISDTLYIKNHACLAIGGDLTVMKKIENINSQQTNIYVYGNFFLPKEFSVPYNFNFLVQGQVYKYDEIKGEYKLHNKGSVGIKGLTNQTVKECNVTKYNDPGNQIINPLWNLSENIDVIYN